MIRQRISSSAAGAVLLASGLSCSASDSPGTDIPQGEPTGEYAQRGAAVALCSASATGRPVLKRLTGQSFAATLQDAFPELEGKWTASFSADPITHYGFSGDADLLTVSKQTAREIDATGQSLGKAVADSVGSLLPCAASADRACAAEFLDTYGARLFRRPLSEEEKNQYLDFFDQAAAKTDFAGAVGWLTRALVHSPNTVYRHEVGEPKGGLRELDQYEIASQLAYAFTGRPPSAELMAQADAGGLDSTETLVATARQLVESPAGKAHLHRFFEAWLEYSRVSTITKSNVDDFETLRDQMREETRRFIEAVVFDESGGFAALMTSASSRPSAALVEFYGWPAPGEDYGSVTRPDGHGIGALAQGSLLASEASPNSSSPTQRGVLVLEKLLCRELPPVPADVPNIPEPTEGEITTRERYENLHAGDGACKTCHQLFDPIGFGFEHFDEAGRYRADEGGLTIDSSGQVPSYEQEPTIAFGGQVELAQGLAQSSEAQACVSGQLKSYFFGAEESCLGESRRAEFMAGDLGFLEYVVSLAAEPHFTHRTAP